MLPWSLSPGIHPVETLRRGLWCPQEPVPTSLSPEPQSFGVNEQEPVPMEREPQGAASLSPRACPQEPWNSDRIGWSLGWSGAGDCGKVLS